VTVLCSSKNRRTLKIWTVYVLLSHTSVGLRLKNGIPWKMKFWKDNTCPFDCPCSSGCVKVALIGRRVASLLTVLAGGWWAQQPRHASRTFLRIEIRFILVSTNLNKYFVNLGHLPWTSRFQPSKFKPFFTSLDSFSRPCCILLLSCVN